MIFGPELVGKVLSGQKTVTRRRLHRRDGKDIRYRVGGVYAIQPGRGNPHVGHLRVTSVLAEPLGHIDRWGAEREGFLNRGEFLWYWEKLHGTPNLEEAVAVIDFQLAPRCPRCQDWHP